MRGAVTTVCLSITKGLARAGLSRLTLTTAWLAGATLFAQPPRAAEDVFVDFLARLLMPASVAYTNPDWDSLDAVKGVTWTPLPPRDVKDCVPDGCYRRDGKGIVSGRNMELTATGARTMVQSIYLVNRGELIGVPNVRRALVRRGYSISAVRCPVKPSSEAPITWYSITSANTQPAVFMTRDICGAAGCEVYGLLLEERPPEMTQKDRSLYTDHCPTP